MVSDPSVTSPADLDDVVRRTGRHRLRLSAFHPTGTAALGSDDQHSPMRPDGQLRGAEGALVAGAGLLPSSRCEPSDHHDGAGARRDRAGCPPRRGMTGRLPPVTNGRPQSRGRGRRVPSCRPAIRRSMTASPRSLRIPRVVYVLPPPTG
ncbi:GMC oxidoreductase [Streptomyces collinus]|uniref:GMC oxidoreductase n=1 Tax=Streptomyces collinus TaxID=42684 RepID=UPI0038268CA0